MAAGKAVGKAQEENAANAAANARSAVVGNNPDEFIQTGLASNFDGEVIEARTVIWDYDNGNGPKVDDQGNVVRTLAVRVTIRPDAGGEIENDVVNYWSAGDPNHFAPSMDGLTPSPVDEKGCSEGIYWLRTGSRQQLGDSTNYAVALRNLREAGFKGQFMADIRFLEGVYGHWDRIAPPKRSGIITAPGDGSKARKGDVLVCSLVKTRTAGAAPARPTAADGRSATARPGAAPVAPTPQAGPNPLDDILRAVVLEALPADGSPIKKGALAGRALKSATVAQGDKAKAVPRITNNAFLEAGMADGLWVFDADAGSVSAIA